MTRASGPAEDPDLGPKLVEAVVDDPDDGHLLPGQIVPSGGVPLQMGGNIAELRRAAGLSAPELAGRSGITAAAVGYFEAGLHIPTLLVAVKIAGSLGASIDRLTVGVFWNPGRAVRDGVASRPRSVREEGYFSARPAHLRIDAPSRQVSTRLEVAAVIGRNLRDARRRRQMSQRDLGPASGLEQTHVSKIELGQLEPTLTTVIRLARELEVPVETLLAGMRWGGTGPADARGDVPGRGGRPRNLNSLDALVARACREKKAPSAIAREISVDEPTVRRCIERLRRKGRSLVADPATWTAADVDGELALRREEDLRAEDPIGEKDATMVVARNLRLHRRRQGLRQEQLAPLGGFGAGSISQFERTAPNFPVTHLVRLAAALRIPCSSLTEGLRWDHAVGSFLLARHPGASDRSPATVIGSNARRIRQAARLPEATVARRVGRRSNYFNALEHGRSVPRPITLLMLARALEAEVEELLVGVRDWYVRPLLPLAMTEEEAAAETAAQQERLLRLWKQNVDLRRIAEDLEMKPKTVFAALNRLREIGVDIPYRKAPMTPAQLSGRLRRRRVSRPLVPR
ncbi:MAG: helix-turn-helix domain-containing protein [Solirubrobacterales bacterium]